MPAALEIHRWPGSPKVVISEYGPINRIAVFGPRWGEASSGAISQVFPLFDRPWAYDSFFRALKKRIALPQTVRLLY